MIKYPVDAAILKCAHKSRRPTASGSAKLISRSANRSSTLGWDQTNWEAIISLMLRQWFLGQFGADMYKLQESVA